MNQELSPLDLELANYSPLELSDLDDTVPILLKAADDGSESFAAARRTIYATFRSAISKRMVTQRDTSRTAEIIPFRRRK